MEYINIQGYPTHFIIDKKGHYKKERMYQTLPKNFDAILSQLESYK